ncbi:hypothetical protein AHAS_Ahas03G0297200 [Arachis hypogaea]
MDKDFVASISYLPAHMLTDELERLKSFTQIFFNPNAFQYGVSAGQDYSNTKKSMTHPSCHLSSGRHVINGIFSQDSEFDILEDGLVSVRVDYDFNYDDISASQKFYSLSIGLYESNTNFQEGNGHQKITFSSHMEVKYYFDFGDPISICQECGALIWIHQKELRAEDYKSLKNAKSTGQTSSSSVGKRIVLPSSFIGGRRYMDGLYHDCVAICGHVGYPDLFITFTCNSEWPEIKRLLDPLHLKPVDRPDIVCRMFKMKLDMLIKDLKKERFFGKVVADLSLTMIS